MFSWPKFVLASGIEHFHLSFIYMPSAQTRSQFNKEFFTKFTHSYDSNNRHLVIDPDHKIELVSYISVFKINFFCCSTTGL